MTRKPQEQPADRICTKPRLTRPASGLLAVVARSNGVSITLPQSIPATAEQAFVRPEGESKNWRRQCLNARRSLPTVVDSGLSERQKPPVSVHRQLLW
jgi:hypothetical protein